jgi:hypothetical protein
MTVDHLSRHLKRDVGANEFEVLLSEEIEAHRPMSPANTFFGRVGRLRMRGMWKEAGYTGRHRHRGRL